MDLSTKIVQVVVVDGAPTPMIETAFHGPTDARGSRVKAWTVGAGKRATTVTVPWDHALDSRENHERAARGLVGKLWSHAHSQAYRLLHCSRDGGGYVFAVVWGAS